MAKRRTVPISRPKKVLFPGAGFTKRNLADYYARVAGAMLPHLRDRPLTLQRFPDGIGESGFYQKDAPDHFPDWIETATMRKEGGTVDYPLASDAAALRYFADQGCITPHVWLSRKDRPDHPDRLVFDLDPPDESDFDGVRRAARDVRDLMRGIGLEPHVMTSGSRGLHVWIALDREAAFDDVRAFARDAAALLARRHPDRLTVEHRKAKRGGRIFLDTLRNAYAQTAVAPYAVRARPGAPVATPLDWDELGASGMGPQRYTIGNLFRRLGRKEDPWRAIGRRARGLSGPRKELDALSE